MSSKENKKLAQQRRAQERAKAERDSKIKKLGIAVLAIAVIAALIFIPGMYGNDADEESAEETSEEVAEDISEEVTDEVTEDAASDDGAAEGEETEALAPELDTTAGRKIKEGDVVNIDYTGYKDGEAFEGGSTNGAGADLAIGSGTYIDGFESGLVGKKVGDTVDLNLTFPEDYGVEDLAGAEVVFTVTINGIYNQ